MKSGLIQQYAHLSQFDTVAHFNKTITYFLKQSEQLFTKSEKQAFQVLTRFSVKIVGVCNARICKLVRASHSELGGISRSSFERMLRKAKEAGIIQIHHTSRERGGTSHNVYVFQKLEGATEEKLTERTPPRKPTTATADPQKIKSETTFLLNNQNTELHRPLTVESLDYTYVPSYVPVSFINTVKPFFGRAKDICGLWDRTVIAFRSLKIRDPIATFIPVITKAFKETVFQWKRRKIKTSFHAYFYGAVLGMLAVEQRRRKATGATGRFLRFLKGNT